MQCPNDNTALASKQVHQRLAMSCSACNGMFVPRTSLWAKSDDAQLAFAISEYLSKAPASKKVCMACAGPMHELSYNAVQIDVCKHCKGVWLDGDEVDSVIRRRGNPTLAMAAGVAGIGAAGAIASQQQQAQSANQSPGIVDALDVAVDAVDVVELGAEGVGVVIEFIGGILSGLS